MEKLLRKTGINQSLRCLLIVASLLFGSSAWGQKTTTIFSETFDQCKGTGGNDGKWSGQNIASSTVTTDNTGWTLVKAGGGKQCVKLGNSSNAGSAKTPSLSFSGDAKLSFKAAPWGTDALNLTLSITNGTLSKTSLKMVKGEWTSFEIDITGVEENSNPKITIAATKRFFLDEVKVTQTTSSGGGETTLTDRNLSFGETKSFDAEVGGTFSAPTLTGVTAGVTYASDNGDVASVNASTGAVTINGMGYAKITASAEADATYKAGSASYDIYVYGKGTIEDLKTYITSTTATDIYFNLTSTAVVTYAATNYAYMEDGHAGIYIYKSSHGLTAGNSFTGKVKAKGMLFNDSYELTEFIPANAAGNADIPVTDLTIQDLTDGDNAGYKKAESMRVKLTGVTVTSDLANKMCTIEQDGYSTTLYLNQTAWTVTNGSTYNITGYPTIYNGTWEFKVIDEADLEATGESKTAATVTFAEESYTVETNGSITVSATTNSTAAIVYSISPADSNVSIDENTGKIVAGEAAGTYTITATVAENVNFTSASASCPLTVTAPAPPSYNITAPTYYKKITSTDELAVGGTYLIVCEGAKKALSATVSTVGYTQGENNTVTNETAATLGEFELIGTDENYKGAALYEFLVDNKYLSGTTSTTISLATSVSDKTKWMVDFDEDGNVEIDNYSTVTASTPRGLLFQTGQTIKHYAISNRGSSNFPALQLYQKVTDLAISTLTNGYATFVTDVPYAMPKGTCGYAVTVAPQAGVITKTEAYTEGSQVPAQTALLIGGTPGTNYYPAVLKEDVAATYSGENYMEGRRTAEGYTNTQKGVAVFYYKLALNSASKPGFYYGAADGAAFQLTKPTTAYLAVPQSITPVNGYLIDFDGEETGISTIAPTNGNANGAIYNLNGIRLTQTLRNLPKGVYIVNGKKVIK